MEIKISRTARSMRRRSMLAGRRDVVSLASSRANEIDALIVQLGHDDFKVREEASTRLAKIGKPALSSLKQALSSGDPEVQSRAEMLIKRIEQRPVPGGPVNSEEPVVARSLRISNDGGTKQVDVKENQRTITIREDGGGIVMIVSAIENGRRVTEE